MAKKSKNKTIKADENPEVKQEITDITEEKPKHPGGRPTTYTFELAEEICMAIATSSDGIKKLCRNNESWPSHQTIYQWLMKHQGFADLYAQAKKNQIEVLVDELVEIADDTTHDETFDHRGEIIPNTEFINRSRVRIDTRKWLAAKLIPRVYGDKITQEHTGKNGEPIKTESTITVEDAADNRSKLFEKLRKKAESEPTTGSSE